MKSASTPQEVYVSDSAAHAQAQAEFTSRDLADHWQVTPRAVNLWRAEAEQKAGRKLGNKRGKKTYFTAEECQLIHSARMAGQDTATAQAQAQNAQAQQRQRYQSAQSDAEESAFDGLDEIVLASDRRAQQLGLMIGQRFNQVVIATASAEMAKGMAQLGAALGEMQTGLEASLSINALPELPELPPLPGTHQIEGSHD